MPALRSPSPVSITSVLARSVASLVSEEHSAGRMVGSPIHGLQGTRPELLRTTTYYEGAEVVSAVVYTHHGTYDLSPLVEGGHPRHLGARAFQPADEGLNDIAIAVLLGQETCHGTCRHRGDIGMGSDGWDSSAGIVRVATGESHGDDVGPAAWPSRGRGLTREDDSCSSFPGSTFIL